jgi:hypothetical protein
MKIDQKLNLVLPIETADGTLYAHSAPVSREVFDRYFMVITKTLATVMSDGLGPLAGRVAAKLLKKTAEERGEWDGPTGVELGLVKEIHRLTHIIAPAKGGGWETVPFGEAVHRGILNTDDAEEVENAVTFFTVVSALMKRESKGLFVQTTPLNCTAFAASLPISTENAHTGPRAIAS